MKKNEKLLAAAVAGITLGLSTPAPAQAGDADEVRCYGINGCGQHAKCSVAAADLDAVKKVLGEKDYRARFGKSQVHGCGQHAKCGAAQKILNWVPAQASECSAQGGIVIEEKDGKKVAKKA